MHLAFSLKLPVAGKMHYERAPRFRRLKLRVALAGLQTEEG